MSSIKRIIAEAKALKEAAYGIKSPPIPLDRAIEESDFEEAAAAPKPRKVSDIQRDARKIAGNSAAQAKLKAKLKQKVMKYHDRGQTSPEPTDAENDHSKDKGFQRFMKKTISDPSFDRHMQNFRGLGSKEFRITDKDDNDSDY